MILAAIKQFNQKQLILVQGEDSKKGHLICLTQKGSFQVILYKMIRFLSGKLKKHTKLAKIVKISIFVNRLVFPMNFNRFSHPMTLPPLPWDFSWRTLLANVHFTTLTVQLLTGNFFTMARTSLTRTWGGSSVFCLDWLQEKTCGNNTLECLINLFLL